MHWVALIAVAAAAGWAVRTYNRLVRNRNLVREAWSGVDVQLKRRYDLVPALVDAVSKYSDHERKLFQDVAARRAEAARAATTQQQQRAENQLSGRLRSLFAVAENYPELRAAESYLKLQQELADVEDQIQLARRYYNGTVRRLNDAVQSFPAMLVARALGFAPADFFEIERATQRSAPRIGEQPSNSPVSP